MNLSSVLKSEGLELFSADTVARRKSAEKRPAPRLKLVGGGSGSSPKLGPGAGIGSARDAAEAAELAGANTGWSGESMASPPIAEEAPAGERWEISCPHCSALLGVPPVQKKSRIKCPKCFERVIIDPKRIASGAPKAAEAAPGSAAVAKQSPLALAQSQADAPRFGAANSALAESPTALARAAERRSAASSSVAIQEPPPALASERDMFSESLVQQPPEREEHIPTAVVGPLTVTPPPRSPTAMFPPGTFLRAEHAVFAMLIAVLPSFAGLALTQFGTEGWLQEVLQSYGNMVRETLIKVSGYVAGS
ncbi:MAG: hypothetical protein L0Z55_09470 [Planctomycetes bacterium]|nr:hypothetical protein [Planctomycetota bacterium]